MRIIIFPEEIVLIKLLKKRKTKIIFIITAVILAMLTAFQCFWIVFANQQEEKTEPSKFIDCFLPMPITGSLSPDVWGADLVGPRDTDNGLEDPELANYEYWDGGIFKNEENGKYYMFGSRWDQAGGHWGNDEAPGWRGSVAIYATSDNLCGPYVDRGMLWADWCEGAGHNVFPFKISKKDTLYSQGYRYAISISDTGLHSETANGTLHISKSLDGPWELVENGNGGRLNVVDGNFSLSNVSICIRKDGKYQTVNRDGDLAIADSLSGEWHIQRNSIWDTVKDLPQGNLEDPVIWYANGLYHIIVNKWDAMCAYYLISEDGITNWKRTNGIAYTPSKDFLMYEDGTLNRWHKLERPNIYMENGIVKAMTFGVVDDVKENDLGYDSHGGKVIVVPFDGEALNKIDGIETEKVFTGVIPEADSHTQTWGDEVNQNYGSETTLNLQKDVNFKSHGMGELGEGTRPDEWYDSKISFIKFPIGELLENNVTEIDNAKLSMIYTGIIAGSSDELTIEAAICPSDWNENEIKWSNQPSIDKTVVKSNTFDSSDKNTRINIDVTDIVNLWIKQNNNADSISIALNTEQTGVRIGVASREAGNDKAPRLLVETESSDEFAIEQFEKKMSSGKIYEGMYAAYKEYLKAVRGEKNNLLYASASMKEFRGGIFDVSVAAADGSYRQSGLHNNDEINNVLYSYGVGNNAPFDIGSNIKYTSGLISNNSEINANYGGIVFINDGSPMTCPVNMIFHNGGSGDNYLRYIKPDNVGFWLEKNWFGYTTSYENHTYQVWYDGATSKSLGYSDWSEMEKPGKNTYTTFSNTLHCSVKPDDYTTDAMYVTWVAENNKSNQGSVTSSAPVYVVNYEYYLNAIPSFDFDVSEYRQGGLSQLLKAYDKALNYNPYSEFTNSNSLDVNNAVQRVKTNMRSNIEALSINPVKDEEFENCTIISFDGEIVTLLSQNGREFVIVFSEYINKYCCAIDVVKDGIINSKDFAYLLKNY